MKKILYITTWLLCGSLYGQSDIHGNIIGKGKPYQAKIALRWNVNNYQIFKQLVSDGVFIDRLILDKENKPESTGWVRLNQSPVKAWPLDRIQNSQYASDTAVALAAQGLYGQTEFPKELSLIEQISYQDMDRQNRHLIVSLSAGTKRDAATVAGLGYEDYIEPDTLKSYVYRISPAVPSGETGKIEPGFIYVAGVDLLYNPFSTKLKTRKGENTVVIHWPADQNLFTGYFIERSENGKDFKQLNKTIYLPDTEPDSSAFEGQHFYYYDSVANYIPYYYRITGVDAFGDKMMFSDTIMSHGIDLTPPVSPELHMNKEDRKLTFTWGKAEGTDLKGYFLLRGKTIHARDGLVAEELFSPETNQFELTLPNNFKSSFYRLMSVDTSGNMSFSNAVYAFIPDVTPPAPPTGLSGFIDTLGIVHVSWALDTTDEAIRGYKIFTANQADHQFLPIEDLVADTTYTFQTELKTLTKKLFVRIVAIDGSYNHSDFSKVLTLTKPDIVPPVPPQILDYKNSDKGIEIFWSSDNSNDFLHTILFRKQNGEDLWQEIYRSAKVTSYLDKNVKPGTAYEYTLQAVDSSGLVSAYASPLYVRTSNSNPVEKIGFTGTYNSGTKMVRLRWNKSAEAVQYFILYKDSGEGLITYKSIPASELTFEESGVASPKGKYALKVKYADHRESDLFICQ
jgi:hypothetical protein